MTIANIVVVPVREGGTVAMAEMPGCTGHDAGATFRDALVDVTHNGPALSVTAMCTDGPLNVVHTYMIHRPFDSISEIGNGPKLLVTFDEEGETRALDLAGARKLHADMADWVTGFGAIVDQLAAAEADLAQAGAQ